MLKPLALDSQGPRGGNQQHFREDMLNDQHISCSNITTPSVPAHTLGLLLALLAEIVLMVFKAALK